MSRALGEGEQGEHGEAEERGQAGEGADFLDQLRRRVAARGYSSEATARRVAARGGDQLDDPLGQVGLVAGQHQVLERVQRRLDPLRVERRLADRAVDPPRRRRLHALAAAEQLLVQLLARAAAG